MTGAAKVLRNVAFIMTAAAGWGTSLSGALAVLASMRSHVRTRLWLPLTVFPALVAFMVLGELFWWE